MKLVDNWRRVVSKAWSIKLALVSAALSATEFALPYVAPAVSSGKFAAVAGAVSLAAALARIVSQPKLWSSDNADANGQEDTRPA